MKKAMMMMMKKQKQKTKIDFQQLGFSLNHFKRLKRTKITRTQIISS